MLKNWIVLMLVSMTLMAPIAAVADKNVMAKLDIAEKMRTKTPLIKIAMNDEVSLQSANTKRTVDKPGANKDSNNFLSDATPQAWLILTALFCFVMRSSRRVV